MEYNGACFVMSNEKPQRDRPLQAGFSIAWNNVAMDLGNNIEKEMNNCLTISF